SDGPARWRRGDAVRCSAWGILAPRSAHSSQLCFGRASAGMGYARAMTTAISIKGVLIEDGRIVLLENERGEWELPGGRVEPGEDAAACLVREFAEELGAAIVVGAIVDCWNYEV